jgi:hypothetical protein
MGGSHHEAAEVVALRREPKRRRGLRWWEPVRRTHRRWSRGRSSSSGVVERRTAKKGSRWWPVAFQAPQWRGAARGKRREALRVRSCGRGRKRRGGPWRSGWQRGVASNSLRPSAVGGGAIVQQGRVAGRGRRGAGAANMWGRDESRAQCQRRGAGGRGVSEAAWPWGTDRWAQPAQCRAARFEMDSTIFTNSNGFKNLQALTDSKSTFLCSKNVK